MAAGDRVCYVLCDNDVRLVPMRPIGRLFGALKHEGPSIPLEDMERGIGEGACEGIGPTPPSGSADSRESELVADATPADEAASS